MMVAMSLPWCRLGRFSNSNLEKAPARRMMRSVGSSRWLVSRASEGQRLKLVMILCTYAWAVKPLSVFLFKAFVRCSIPIYLALSLAEGSPSPTSLSVRCISSVGKFRRSPTASLIALLRMSSMVDSWRSLKTPR